VNSFSLEMSMSYRQKSLNPFLKKGFQLGLQPLEAWISILSLVLVIALGLLIGAGKFLILVFPAGCLAVGLLLYLHYPILYVGFTWWMWFLAPLVRRLIDYQSGYITPGTWNLAPLLVTSISFVTLVRHFPRSFKQGGLPFILCLGSVFYGFLSYLIQRPIDSKVITILLSWSAPILFSFHIFTNWRDYPSYRQNIQRTFLWGVLVMGIYGIWQYLVAPDWDKFWLTQPGNCACFGIPEPLGFRVWSTMFTPMTFAANMLAGLLLLFSNQSPLRFLATGVGYLAFLLSSVRTAWLSWLIGLLFLFSSLKARLQMRLIVGIVVAALCAIPLVTMEPFSSAIGSRLGTFSNLGSDTSVIVRQKGYQKLTDPMLSQFMGQGLSVEAFSATQPELNTISVDDNGLLKMLFSLGWFGTIPYLAGISLLFFKLFQTSEIPSDTFAKAARAIAGGVFLGEAGAINLFDGGDITMPLWGFLGVAMAAHKYYFHQRTVKHCGS